jgi:hypothetical protein
MKNKNFCSLKDISGERETTDRKKMFSNHISEKRFKCNL